MTYAYFRIYWSRWGHRQIQLHREITAGYDQIPAAIVQTDIETGWHREQSGDHKRMRSGIVATDDPNSPHPDHRYRHRRKARLCSLARPQAAEIQPGARQGSDMPSSAQRYSMECA
jgi:hypothetical protein